MKAVAKEACEGRESRLAGLRRCDQLGEEVFVLRRKGGRRRRGWDGKGWVTAERFGLVV